MNIFVTVGTTSFDPLVEAIDKGPFADTALMQIADGDYQPVNARWFSFEPGIQNYIDNADVVVCHAGAGTVFKLLEQGKIPLVVPNTVRRDKHQLEMARWLKQKNYAVVAMSTGEVNQKLIEYSDEKINCVAFSEKRFFYQKALNDLVRTHLGIGP